MLNEKDVNPRDLLTSVTLWLVLFLTGLQQQTAGLPEDKGKGGVE